MKYSRSYTGITSDINKRFEKHNKGQVQSTKSYRPWVLAYIEKHNTISEAKKREWFLKYTPEGGKLKRKILKMAGIPVPQSGT